MNVRRALLSVALVLGVVVGARAGDRPMDKAKAGEWVLEKNVASGFTTWTYMWIAKVDGRKVTVMVQLLKDEQLGLAPGQPTVVDLDKPDAPPPPGSKPKTSEEEVEVKGRKLKCTKTESEVEIQGVGKMATTTWTAAEIPIYGKAKMVVKDQAGKVVAEQETLDFGHEGGAERPLK